MVICRNCFPFEVIAFLASYSYFYVHMDADRRMYTTEGLLNTCYGQGCAIFGI
jgi:hypothetical protein